MPLSSSMISLVCRLCILSKINLSIQLLRPLRSISCSNGQHRQESRISTSGSIREVSKRPGRKAYQRNWKNCTMRQRNVRCVRFSIILLRASCGWHSQCPPHQSKFDRRHDWRYMILTVPETIRLPTADIFILYFRFLLLCTYERRSCWQDEQKCHGFAMCISM